MNDEIQVGDKVLWWELGKPFVGTVVELHDRSRLTVLAIHPERGPTFVIEAREAVKAGKRNQHPPPDRIAGESDREYVKRILRGKTTLTPEEQLANLLVGIFDSADSDSDG